MLFMNGSVFSFLTVHCKCLKILLKSFISFWGKIRAFLSICPLQIQFYFFHYSLDALYFFFLPNYLDRTFNIIFNKNVESRYHCLVLGVREKASRPLPLNVMSVVVFHRCFLSGLEVSFYSQIFLMKGVGFCQLFFMHLLRWE